MIKFQSNWPSPHRNVLVADHTAIATVHGTVVGQYSLSIQLDSSYHLKNFTVKEFHSSKYLSMGRENAHITEIDDIGNVIKSPTDENNTITMQCANCWCTCAQHAQDLPVV